MFLAHICVDVNTVKWEEVHYLQTFNCLKFLHQKSPLFAVLYKKVTNGLKYWFNILYGFDYVLQLVV